MKRILAVLMLVSLAGAARADEKVTLSGVHNCCGSCVKGINAALGTVPGLKSDIADDKVTMTGASNDDLQKGVDAMVAAGYTGDSDNAAIKVNAGTAPDEKVTALTVSGTHMCCGKCVKQAQAAVKAVPGVTGDTIKAGAKSFTVSGDFNAKDLMAALAKAGFTGTATK